MNERFRIMNTRHRNDGWFSGREQRFAFLLFLAVGALTVVDILEDLAEGATAQLLLIESAIAGSAIVGGALLWREATRRWQEAHRQVEADLARVNSDFSRWREETASLYRDLAEAISARFRAWSLTSAESEVAVLLLKGFSHREIADMRETSERTVRQQAAVVYEKSGLDGRAQLAAFFLQDLLEPRDSLTLHRKKAHTVNA